LCYNDTIQSKYIPSAIKNTIDRGEKNIDGKALLADENGWDEKIINHHVIASEAWQSLRNALALMHSS
jgi:hypothetical protein